MGMTSGGSLSVGLVGWLNETQQTNQANPKQRVGEKSSRRYLGCRVKKTNNCWVFVAFAHRPYLMCSSVLVVAILDSSTSTEVTDLPCIQQCRIDSYIQNR